MKNLEISEKEKKDMSEHSILSDKPKYPYGMQINFDPETYAKLDLPEVPEVGAKMMILAMVEVCNLSQYKTDSDVPKVSMTLQITDIEIKSASEEKEKKSAEAVLYGED